MNEAGEPAAGHSLTPAMRRSIIEEELLFAIQGGRISQADRHVALWYMRAAGNAWTLDQPGVSTELRARVLSVSPTLALNEVDKQKQLDTVNQLGV